MPNENPEFQERVPPDVEAFFAQIANVLNDFGSNYNLMLERYYHEAPCWKFNFRHPQGGAGSIDVFKESEDSLKIYAHWWIDDFEKFARFLRTEETPEYKVNSIDLAETLENQLKKIISWQKDELTRVDIDYELYWKPYKEKLVNYVEQYPQPKI